MAIKRFVSNKDNVITNAYKFDLDTRATDSNMGQSDIVEVFNIFGQQSRNSIEKSRTIIQFPVDEVVSQRSAGNIPSSGSVRFILRMFNAEHGQSVPRNFYLDVCPLAQSWDEGYGLDMESFVDTGASNWLSASDASTTQITKFTFLSASAYDYRGGSVSLYEQDGDRHNFYFQHHATASAPVLDGTEHEVDVKGKVTPSEVATAFRNFVNPVSGFSAVSQDGNAAVVLVTSTTAGSVSTFSINSLPSNTITGQITQTGTDAVLWTSEGGSTWKSNIKDTEFSSYSQQFVSGREHLEIDITGLVEEWVKGEVGAGLTKSSGSVNFTGTPVDNSTITLISTDGLAKEYRFLSSGITNAETGSSDSSIIFVDTSSGNTSTIATNFKSAVTSINAHSNRFTVATDATLVSLTQSVAGFGGNTKVATTGVPNATVFTYLSGGHGAHNYGLMVSLQGTYEDGSLATSFYTKKFFARGSEFELKRPILEARWNSSVTDDRNDFYLSSSMLSAADNLNSIYLYNYFRGSLNNLPNVGTGSLYVKFLNSSGAEITTSTPRNPITASYSSTGVYRAQVALTTNETPVTDVWFFEKEATATITTTGNPGNNQTFSLKNTAGTTVTFVFKTDSTTVDGTLDGSNVIIGVNGALGSAAAVGDRIRSAINNASGLNITATETAGGAMTLTQDVKGSAGNTTINTDAVDTVSSTSFDGGIGPTEFNRGTIVPKTHTSKGNRPDFNYVSKLLNLKSSYNSQEKPRLRLYIRERDWRPNIYTIASRDIESTVIKNAYYKLERISDNFPVINYGTGSVEYTKLSYDVSGSYFDLDMSMLEEGYAYEISIVYKLDNDYKEQNDKFRFRVDK